MLAEHILSESGVCFADAPASRSGGSGGSSPLVRSRNLTGALLRCGDVEWLPPTHPPKPIDYTSSVIFAFAFSWLCVSRADMAYLGHFNNSSRLAVVGGAVFKRGLV